MSETADATSPSLLRRIFNALDEETAAIRPLVNVADAVSRVLPLEVGNRFRASLLRGIGFAVGTGTLVRGAPNVGGTGERSLAGKLSIGRDCVIDVDCTFDLGAPITIGDRVTLGHQVMILTSTHELGPREHRAGPLTMAPVTIAAGAWIGPRCVILPGVTIGEGAVVAPGSVVNKDVDAHTRVGGIPARKLEALAP
jgi:maltose O-acetyltransferase